MSKSGERLFRIEEDDQENLTVTEYSYLVGWSQEGNSAIWFFVDESGVRWEWEEDEAAGTGRFSFLERVNVADEFKDDGQTVALFDAMRRELDAEGEDATPRSFNFSFLGSDTQLQTYTAHIEKAGADKEEGLYYVKEDESGNTLFELKWNQRTGNLDVYDARSGAEPPLRWEWNEAGSSNFIKRYVMRNSAGEVIALKRVGGGGLLDFESTEFYTTANGEIALNADGKPVVVRRLLNMGGRHVEIKTWGYYSNSSVTAIKYLYMEELGGEGLDRGVREIKHVEKSDTGELVWATASGYDIAGNRRVLHLEVIREEGSVERKNIAAIMTSPDGSITRFLWIPDSNQRNKPVDLTPEASSAIAAEMVDPELKVGEEKRFRFTIGATTHEWYIEKGSDERYFIRLPGVGDFEGGDTYYVIAQNDNGDFTVGEDAYTLRNQGIYWFGMANIDGDQALAVALDEEDIHRKAEFEAALGGGAGCFLS